MINYSVINDNQLISLLQQGDDKAFTELYDRYWEKLLERAIIKLKSVDDAQELVQDIFIRLWNRRENLNLRTDFHIYISAALKYEIINKLAGRKKMISLIDSAELDMHSLKMPDYSTNRHLEFIDLQQRLEASVQRLPEKCRIVFRLSRECGLSEKEISEELQISRKTVQGHITHALKTLRSSLGSIYIFFL